MKIEKELTDSVILEELGRRLGRRRLDLQLTQAELAEQAGLGKRTIERIETGGDTQVSSLIRVLRVLDLVDGLERLVPDPGIRPMDLLKLRGKERKRASSNRKSEQGGNWRWGDDK